MAGHAERLEAELEAAEHKFRELDTNGAQTLYAATQHCPMLPCRPASSPPPAPPCGPSSLSYCAHALTRVCRRRAGSYSRY